MPDDPLAHWDAAYAQGDTSRSWYQSEAQTSVELIRAAGLPHDAGIVDVGGGASTLIDGLLAADFADVTVLDISPLALDLARQRLGREQAALVTWVAADVLTWMPERTYHLWHDRAVLHFMTTPEARAGYRRALLAATAPGSIAIFGVFGPDGPTACSGLPTARYDEAALAAFLGDDFQLLASDLRHHRTPAGADQQFLWARARRRTPDPATDRAPAATQSTRPGRNLTPPGRDGS